MAEEIQPGTFTPPRVSAIPPAPRPGPPRTTPAPSLAADGFVDRPRRGDPAAVGYVDTGVLYAFGACNDHAARLAFLDLYRERLLTGVQVRAEVWGKALLDVTRNGDQAATIAAAKVARDALLAGDHIGEATGDVQARADTVFRQLQDYDRARELGADRTANPSALSGARHSSLAKHAGEAELIAYAATAKGKTVLLTNDSGASAVAASQNVPARHFGHVLHELVCEPGNGIDAASAVELFERGVSVSKVAHHATTDLRSDPERWMRCASYEPGRCLMCESQPG
jgi:hypothetical protein